LVSGILVIGAASTAFLTWPDSRQMVDGRQRLYAVVGWAIVGAAVAGAIGVLVIAGAAATELIQPVVFVALLIVLAGVMIARMPSMVVQVARSRAEIAAAKAPAPARAAFDGIAEGLRAPLAVVRGLPFLLQIAGPWVVVLAGGAFAILSGGQAAGHDGSDALARLTALAVLLIAGLYVVLPSVLVAWTNWIVDGGSPKWIVATPNRAAFGFAWRIWLALTFLGVLDKNIATPLAKFLSGSIPQLSVLVDNLTTWIVALLMIMLFSSAALFLPAIAVADKTFDRSAALVRGRKMWPGLPVGLALSLAPIPLAAWALTGLLDAAQPAAPRVAHAPLTPLDALALVVWLLVMLATLVSGMTFLTRAYLAARTPVADVFT
jgi:hypothetical protein